MNKRFDIRKPMQVGGQAVIEGVMMRGPRCVATAVRRAGGEIVVKKERYIPLAERYTLLRIPILRGGVGLMEMMILGIKTLNFSAEAALEDAAPPEANRKKETGRFSLAFMVLISLLAGIAVFFATPLVVTTSLFNVEQEPLAFNAIAGLIRVGLLLGYLLLISMANDIKRLFQYHGAEHKAVFAFERGETLEVPSAARQTRFHPRCGTSFLLIVMCVAVILFSLLDALMIRWMGNLTIVVRLLTHLPFLPLIGGVSYELIKISARHSTTTFGRAIVAPGLWLQRITTREPDERQLEVAIIALRSALEEDVPEVLEPVEVVGG